MATEAQVTANCVDAQKSTGPRTPEGKAVVAQNAVKHGLLAQEVVIKGEDLEEFALYREGMLAELAPAGRVKRVRRDVGFCQFRLPRWEFSRGGSHGRRPPGRRLYERTGGGEAGVPNKPNLSRPRWHGHLAREGRPWAGRPCHGVAGRWHRG